MNYSYCDSEMIHGYLNCGNMIWSEKKHKISTFPDGKGKCFCHCSNGIFYS